MISWRTQTRGTLHLLLWMRGYVYHYECSLYYTVKLWNAHFWATLDCPFSCYQWKFNLIKSSSCHLKIIQMWQKIWEEVPFASGATWWFSKLENGEYKWCTSLQDCSFICPTQYKLITSFYYYYPELRDKAIKTIYEEPSLASLTNNPI